MSKSPSAVADLFAKIREVSVQNVHLRKTLQLVRQRAQRALENSDQGAIEWRYALEEIVALTEQS